MQQVVTNSVRSWISVVGSLRWVSVDSELCGTSSLKFSDLMFSSNLEDC